MLAVRLARLFLLGLIILIWRKVQIMKLLTMDFLEVASSLLGPNILSATVPKDPVYVVPVTWETKFRTHTEQEGILEFCMF
jgi:hypothetical protein